MFASRWQRVPVLLVALVAVAFGLAGCGSWAILGSGASTVKPASRAKAASVDAKTVLLTAAKLRRALLTQINGAAAAAPAAEGTYSTLPGTKQVREAGFSVDPKSCADASMASFDTREVESAPAASVTFRIGSNGISEVLLSPSDPSSALERGVPAECARYTATTGGRTYNYALTDSGISGIGDQARLINVQTVGYPSDDIWAVLYRGPGFVGAVTIVGPEASEVAVRELGTQAYGYAAKLLS
ncbi:MAG TPA: hypothetical protein VG142_12105 [Trebonia sp.]|jgi:hypothetical protein|nr:hypothetical protein [Trebonia sp.]